MKKIGLALGGGVVLGAAHIGVLKALNELNIKPTYLSGTSIGAFVGVFYAFGKTVNQIEAIATELEWASISELSISRYGLMSNKKIGKLIEKHLGKKALLEDAQIPISIVATNIATGKKEVLTTGLVSTAVMASTCLPGVFHPVTRNNQMLVDGGLVENVPVETVKKMGAEQTICVDLNHKKKAEKPQNIIEVLVNSFQFALMASDFYQNKLADILIQPDLTKFSLTDMSQIKPLMEMGYKEAINKLSNLKL